ncbi:MAG: hypothetical protein ACP5I3_10620 [Thermoproteus sp.]
MILQAAGFPSPVAFAVIAGAVATVGSIVVISLAKLDRRWMGYASLVVEIALTVLFAYVVSAVYAVYSSPQLTPDAIAEGIAYQRVAAGVLSAMLFVAGVSAISYYFELPRRGHE